MNVPPSKSDVQRSPGGAVVADSWAYLRQHTAARIALGRSGGSLPTHESLRFAHDHALARDAVHAPFDAESLAEELRRLPESPEVLTLTSAATDRTTYLQRPDLGRRLSEPSRAQLSALDSQRRTDLAVIVSDGLSALAAQRQGPPLLAALLPRLREAGFTLAPVCVVKHARVNLQDEIGERLGAELALILLGERPGLGTADSLGAYLVFGPRVGNTNAQRNCVSNIRPEGLPPAEAAARIAALLIAARKLRLSGVGLKEEGPRLSQTHAAESSEPRV